MIQLECFLSQDLVMHRDAVLALTEDRNGVTTRSGRVARWMGKFQTSANREIANRFDESLKGRYGKELSDQVRESRGLDRLASLGKPLTVRQVQDASREAHALQVRFKDSNMQLVRSYSVPLLSSDRSISLMQMKIAHSACKASPEDPSVAKLVKPEDIAFKFEQAIANAGSNGTHLVTTEEAARILTKIVDQEVETSRRAAQNGASVASEAPDGASAHPVQAQEVQQWESSYVTDMKNLIQEILDNSPYVSLPGGKSLVDRVALKVDRANAVIQLVLSDVERESHNKGSEEATAQDQERLARAAIEDAEQAVFLTGYGIRNGSERKVDCLQQVFDRHPHARDLLTNWGITINAARLSPSVHEKFSETLSARLSDALTHPEHLRSGAVPIKDKVDQLISQSAHEMVGEFIGQRTDTLIRLMTTGGRDEYAHDLVQVVLHRGGSASEVEHLLKLSPEAIAHLAEGTT